MQPMAALRKRFETEVWPRPFEPLPQIGADGLTLGHGTVLARWAQNRPGRAFAEADDERVIVLLSTVYGRAVSPYVMKHVARAATRWGAGEKALAHIELAFAGLPRLESSADAYRLFLADSLLDDGTTLRQLAHITYDVFFQIGNDRGMSRIIIDLEKGDVYYTNTHYRSFYNVKVSNHHKSSAGGRYENYRDRCS